MEVLNIFLMLGACHLTFGKDDTSERTSKELHKDYIRMQILNMTEGETCRGFRKHYMLEIEGGSPGHIPRKPATDSIPAVCGLKGDKGTCCSKKMNEDFLQTATRTYQIAAVEIVLINPIAKLSEATKTFSAIIEEVVQLVRRDMSRLLHAKLGLPRREAINIGSILLEGFSDFRELPRQQLRHSVETFLDLVFPYIFRERMKTNERVFAKNYHSCVQRSRANLRLTVYGDYIEPLTLDLAAAHASAALVVQALQLGVNASERVIHSIQRRSAESCSAGMARLVPCALCVPLDSLKDTGGRERLRRCQDFCNNVMSGCWLHTYTSVGEPWARYIQSVTAALQEFQQKNVVERMLLLLPHKTDKVIEHARHQMTQVHEKIVKECGSPDYSAEDGDPPGRGGGDSLLLAIGPSVMEVLNSTVSSIRDLETFYEQVPRALCKRPQFSSRKKSEHCWNGETFGSYDKPQYDMQDPTSSNPEYQQPIMPSLTPELNSATQTIQNGIQWVQQAGQELSTLLEEQEQENVFLTRHQLTYESVTRRPPRHRHAKHSSGRFPTDDEDLDISGSGSGDELEEAEEGRTDGPLLPQHSSPQHNHSTSSKSTSRPLPTEKVTYKITSTTSLSTSGSGVRGSTGSSTCLRIDHFVLNLAFITVLSSLSYSRLLYVCTYCVMIVFANGYYI